MERQTSAIDVPPHVLEYMKDHETLTLATASPGGVPHATTLVYVSDGAVVYIWTRPETTTARHVDQNPVVSFAIDEYSPDWRQTKGIQARGDCAPLLDASEIERVTGEFEEKFPALAGALGTNLSYFRITPTELRFIDNTAEGGDTDPSTFHRDLVYSVFRDLPEQGVETVEAHLRTVQVGDGDVVVRQGAPADKFFIIVDGEVEVVREDDGETRSIATLGQGQFFGEMAILRDTPRMATVRAVKPTTLFSMERDVFRSLVAQSMGTTEDFDATIRGRLDEIRGTGSA
ncbi:MAG: cyclic nucleotide-binding domain-containing protein [Actinobacteria bacterium]|nr:cyclic nucleotide-binding domain-containing protein [Actinomycetota bacterium]